MMNEIPANPRYCRDSSEVKAWHFRRAKTPLSPALGVPGIQMTGALINTLLVELSQSVVESSKKAEYHNNEKMNHHIFCNHTIIIIRESPLSFIGA